MKKPDSDRIHELCSMIAVEQDRENFLKLVEELNRILEAKDEQLQRTSRTTNKRLIPVSSAYSQVSVKKK